MPQEFCDAGLISVNGATAKSSKEVKVGDQIEIRRRNRLTRVNVTQLPATKQVSKNAVGELYGLIEEIRTDDESI
jgi:ribosomal 50S subunit-recycling heat shock protein